MLWEIEGLYSRIVGRCQAMPMSETGQTEKYSARADVFRSSSDNGRGFSARKGRYADRRSWRLQWKFVHRRLWNFDRARLPLCARAEVGKPTAIAALPRNDRRRTTTSIARSPLVRQAYYAANQSALTALSRSSRITGSGLHC